MHGLDSINLWGGGGGGGGGAGVELVRPVYTVYISMTVSEVTQRSLYW